MNDKNPELKKEAWGWLKHTQTVHLATWDGEHPRVRPVSMIFDEERFWVSTGCSDAKMDQIEQYPVFEFSLLLENDEGAGTLRCTGTTRIVTDLETKSMMAERIPFFSQFWDSPEEDSYCLIELMVERAEFMRPGEMYGTNFSV